eukprot:GHVS01075174.1.p2 GENE.GHVS01075174.1~~GHVS01075174.1.p2  ORF type:complete len:103 (+),score=20.25 GHVS01075174.1:308-616(+)
MIVLAYTTEVEQMGQHMTKIYIDWLLLMFLTFLYDALSSLFVCFADVYVLHVHVVVHVRMRLSHLGSCVLRLCISWSRLASCALLLLLLQCLLIETVEHLCV